MSSEAMIPLECEYCHELPLSFIKTVDYLIFQHFLKRWI